MKNDLKLTFIIESAYDGQSKSCSSWCEHAENVVDEVDT